MKKTIKTIAGSFILLIFVCAVLSACGGSGTYATQKNFVTIGCVVPLTGDLAGYGEGTLETEEQAVEAINEGGGVYIDTLERKLKVRFVVADSMSTVEGAAQAAMQLISDEHVDMMISSSGARTALPVASVCDEQKIPFFSTGCENGSWLASGEHPYGFNCSYNNLSRLAAFADVWAERGITSIGLLAPATEEADRFAADLAVFCAERQLSLADPGRLDMASGKFSAAVKALSKAKVKAVICCMSAEEFSALWAEGSLKTLEYDMCILVHDDFLASDAAKLVPGAEIKEFYTAACWDKTYPFTSSLTDEEGAQLGRFYDDKFLTQSSETVGFKHASAELAVDAVKLAMALDAESIRSAAESLNVDTVLGLVDFDETHSSILPCSVLKWNYDPRIVSWTKELISHSQLGEEVEFDEE